MQIIFTISEEKIQRVIDAMKGLFPIPLDVNGNPIYTDGQWAKEKLRRVIVEFVYQYELKVVRTEARALVDKDNDLVT